ncbi:hypothetical protein TWF694_003093 [Orbilia ellipsospora]|uniref:Cytochrome c domain-containing protein n=1 Tax=Orbilia ellipsospora TaxID=2528407 RepID=A0AAV9X0L1_9PEZI
MLFSSALLLAITASIGAQAFDILDFTNDNHVAKFRKRDTTGALDLRPLREDEIFPHLRKRAEFAHSQLEPQDSIRMVYMGINHEHHARVAEIKIRKPDARHPLLLLENLDSLTKNITCIDRDNMSIEFNSPEAMSRASKAWDFVNRSEDDYFYLITHHHHEGCGNDEERTPFKVVAVKNDTKSITLTRKETTWSEAAKYFEMNIDTVKNPNHPEQQLIERRAHLERRKICGEFTEFWSLDWWSCMWKREAQDCCHSARVSSKGCSQIECSVGTNIAETTEAVAQAVDKLSAEVVKGIGKLIELIPLDKLNWESKVHTFGQTTGIKNIQQRLPKGQVGFINVQADCVGCHLNMSISTGVYAKADESGFSAGIRIRPRIAGKLELQVDGAIQAGYDLNALDQFVNYLDKGDKVTKFIKFSPDVLNGFGISFTGKVAANFTTGLSFDAGDSAQIELNVGNGQGKPGNWNVKPTADSWFRPHSFDASLTISPYFRLGVGVGVELFNDNGKTSIPGLKSIQSVKYGAWAGYRFYDENIIKYNYIPAGGVCGKSDITSGVGFTSQFKVDRGYRVVNTLPTENLIRKLWDNPGRDIFKVVHPGEVHSHCIKLGTKKESPADIQKAKEEAIREAHKKFGIKDPVGTAQANPFAGALPGAKGSFGPNRRVLSRMAPRGGDDGFDSLNVLYSE